MARLRAASLVYARSDFARKVTSTFGLQLLVLLLAFANSALVTRWLGPEGKGVLTLALLIPGTLSLFLNAGIGMANVYFAGSRRLSVAQLTANSVSFTLIGTLLGVGAVGVARASGLLDSVLPGLPHWTLPFALLILPISLASGYFAPVFQGLQRIIQVNLVNVAQSFAGLGLALLFVVGFGLGLAGALLATLGASLASLILLFVMLRREGGVFVPRWEPAVVRSTLAFGMRGHLGNVLQFFNYRLDVFVVNYFLGPAEVGIYSIAVLLAELLWQFPNAVAFVIFPKASASTPEAMNAFTPRVFGLTLGVTAAAAFVLAALGRPFIDAVYTSDFAPAYGALLVLLPGVVLLGGGKVLTNEIAGRGYAHYNSINSGLALVITLLLDVLLIPRYGILGAALASSIAYAFNLVTALVFYRLVSRRVAQPA